MSGYRGGDCGGDNDVRNSDNGSGGPTLMMEVLVMFRVNGGRGGDNKGTAVGDGRGSRVKRWWSLG